MMTVKFRDHYTQVTSYFGDVDGYKFVAEVKYTSISKKWLVTDIRWLFGEHPKKDKAETRIDELVKGFFKKEEK
jgi:hypothetical protein